MEIQSRRSSLENIRSVQRARALALNNSVTQGASLGSGLQGGYAQISSQGNYNEQGIAQSLMTGRSLFDISSQISDAKMQELSAKQGLQEGAAYSQLGNSISTSIPKLNQLSQGGLGGFGTGVWNASTNNFLGSGSFNKG